MSDIIYNYLINKFQVGSDAARLVANKYTAHPALRQELETYIEQGVIGRIEIEGYTVTSILKMAPFLQVVGAYGFLVTLKETPAIARNIIRKAFQPDEETLKALNQGKKRLDPNTGLSTAFI